MTERPRIRAFGLSLGLALAAWVAVLAGCKARPSGNGLAARTAETTLHGDRPAGERRGAPEAPSGASSAVEGPVRRFEALETWSGGAHPGDRVPLILALHGLGDSPEGFAELYRGFPCAARILLPHSDVHYGRGFSWFSFHPGDPDAAAPEIMQRADALFAFVSSEARSENAKGRPLVTGFSQGGALAFAMAARHGADLGGAFPIGGWLPSRVEETANGSAAAPLVAFHGVDDPLIAVERPRAAVSRLVKDGFRAKLLEFEGAGHGISGPERTAYFERLAAACAAEGTRP